jgi:peptidoglycan hydrolase CwlO-like protein
MEIILAFGLGIVLVSTIVLVYVVLKSNKKVNELSHLERSIQEVYRNIDEQNGNIHRELDTINGKIDSRVDKLYDNISRELGETNRKVEFLRKSLGKDYF